MNNRKRIAGMIVFGLLFALLLSAFAVAEGDTVNADDAESTFDGTPSEDMTDEIWKLRFPLLDLEMEIYRSPYDNALDLYKAQLSGETDQSARIAKDMQEGCGNSIVYVYDDGQLAPAVLEAIENEMLVIEFATFSPGYYCADHRVHAVLNLSPTDESSAIYNMTDFEDEQKLKEYTDYVIEHADRIEDPEFWDGGPLLTIVIWGPEDNADWLAIVAQEEPMLLE